MISFICLGALTASIREVILFKDHYSTNYIDNSEYKINYVLTKELKSDFYVKRFYAQLKRINDFPAKGKVLVSVRDSSLTPVVGQEWQGYQKIQAINQPQSLGQFDYSEYLKKRDVYGQIFLDKKTSIYLSDKKNLKFYTLRLRLYLIDRLKAAISDKEAASLAAALIFGERKDIEISILEDFKRAGVMHVLAISGLHIGILFSLLSTFFNKFPPYLKTSLIVILLWIYVFLSGFSPSVIRAVLMFTIVSLVVLMRRDHNMPNTIALAMLISLSIRPRWIYEIDFQLSYAAVFSIAFFYPVLHPYTFSKWKFISYFKKLIAVSIVVQLGLLPLILFYFHQFPKFFLIGNLIAVPSIMLLLFQGFIILFFSFIWLDFSVHIGRVFAFFSKLLYKGIALLNSFDFIVIENIPFHLSMVFSYTICFYCFGFFLKMKTIRLFYLFLISLFLLQLNTLIIKNIYAKKEILILANHKKEPILLHKRGNASYIYLKDRSLNIESLEKPFAIYTWSDIIQKERLFVEFNWKEKKVLIVDNEACMNINKRYHYLLFSGYVKINYDRLIGNLKPEKIIIHNTVPRRNRELIKEICIKKEIPFHDNYEKGFYEF